MMDWLTSGRLLAPCTLEYCCLVGVYCLLGYPSSIINHELQLEWTT